MKPQLKHSGISMAVAAAALLSGCAMNNGPDQTAGATTDLVHCYDVNVCKGHNDCKTADNACAGFASCKGTGFVAMPSKSCKDVGGSIKDKWVGQANVADLVHCHGVNICKGHNDCKTAENACAGQASCKGTGFVMSPAKSCADIGGTES
jgi:hypothetical protein